jgi:hypothetical protein
VSEARAAASALHAACMQVGRAVRLFVARWGGGTHVQRSEKNQATAEAAVEYRCFRVESAEPYGWVVYLEGTRRTHFFMARGLALSLAKLWAQAIPPSKVQLVDLTGRVTQEWTFRPRLTNA